MCKECIKSINTFYITPLMYMHAFSINRGDSKGHFAKHKIRYIAVQVCINFKTVWVNM